MWVDKWLSEFVNECVTQLMNKHLILEEVDKFNRWLLRHCDRHLQYIEAWSRDQKAGGTEKFPALVPMAVDAAGSWGFLLSGRWGWAVPAAPSWCLRLWKLQEAAGASSGGWAKSTGRILIFAHHSFLFTPLAPSLPPLAPPVLSTLYLVPPTWNT